MHTRLNPFQARAVQRFRSTEHLILNFATGAGKTLAALACAESVAPQSVLLLVAEKSHIETVWKAEMAKHGIFIDVEAYHQWHARPRRNHYNLLIYDEAHLITERVVAILSRIKFDRTLWLTGTLESERYMRILSLVPAEVLQVTLDETTKAGTTKAVNVLFLPIDGAALRNQFVTTIGRGSTPTIVNILTHQHFFRGCYTIRGRFSELYEQLSSLIRRTRDVEMKKRIGLVRKRLLVAAKSKALANILPVLVSMAQDHDKRILVWSMNKKTFAPLMKTEGMEKALGRKVTFRSLAYFGDNPDREAVLQRWLDGKQHIIYASKLLVTGANLPECVSLFLALSLEYQSQAAIMQKIGRITRHGGNIVLPYIKGTKEEDAIAKIKRQIPKSWMVKEIPSPNALLKLW